MITWPTTRSRIAFGSIRPAEPIACVVMSAQRDFWLSADISVLEEFIGGPSVIRTVRSCCTTAPVASCLTWPHVSGIIALDHRHGAADSTTAAFCCRTHGPATQLMQRGFLMPGSSPLPTDPSHGCAVILRPLSQVARVSLQEPHKMRCGSTESDGHDECSGWKPTSNPHCWLTPEGMLESERPPLEWIDTNVILEFYSFADIIDAKQNRSQADVEMRRLRAQGTLWLVMVLCAASCDDQLFQCRDKKLWSHVHDRKSAIVRARRRRSVRRLDGRDNQGGRGANSGEVYQRQR